MGHCPWLCMAMLCSTFKGWVRILGFPPPWLCWGVLPCLCSKAARRTVKPRDLFHAVARRFAIGFAAILRDENKMEATLVMTGAWLDYDLPKSYWEWNNHPKWLSYFSKGLKHVETTNQEDNLFKRWRGYKKSIEILI